MKKKVPTKKIGLDRATKKIIGHSNYCLFCERPRFVDKRGEQLWVSKMTLIVGYYTHHTFTVCPECRKKHTFADAYQKIRRKPTIFNRGMNAVG